MRHALIMESIVLEAALITVSATCSFVAGVANAVIEDTSMYLSEFSLEDYKSMRCSGDLSFTRCCNVIVAPNDLGKTALVTCC